MRYFSDSDVRLHDKTIILENYSYEKKKSYDTFHVFLSHSTKDQAKLPSVINFLSKYGVNVYIDKSDKELPQKTSPETGEKLKKRIYEAKKFIVLVTQNSKESKWIPWELGIADEKKKIENVALLPIVQNQITETWQEQEYLGLYHRIVFRKIKNVWVVLDHHKNKEIELSEWLKRQ